MRKRSISVSAFMLMVLLSYIPESVANVSKGGFLIAQSSRQPAFSLPDSVPRGTTVKINGSASLSGINSALKQGFEDQFPGTKVDTQYSSTDTALAALQQGEIDVAAIDRPLTNEEKAQNLVALPLSRQSIVVVVGADNPFAEDLDVEQFIQILEGEITDWSELGETAAPIRVIERSLTDPARQALQRYSIFDQAFEPNDQTVKLEDDQTQAMIEALGDDGISFAMADQVIDQPGARIVPLHGTLPGDSNYPFSSPLSYVYQGSNPTPAVQAYLGYVTAPDTRQIIDSGVKTLASQSETSKPEADTKAEPVTASASEKPAATGSTAVSEKPSNAGSASEKPSTTEQAAASSKDQPASSDTKADASKVNSKKTIASSYLLPWWRWLIVVPVAGVFLWSLFSDNHVEMDETEDEMDEIDEIGRIGDIHETELADGEADHVALASSSTTAAHAYWKNNIHQQSPYQRREND